MRLPRKYKTGNSKLKKKKSAAAATTAHGRADTVTGIVKADGHTLIRCERKRDGMESIRTIVLNQRGECHMMDIKKDQSVYFIKKDWKGLDYRCALGDTISATKELLTATEGDTASSNLWKGKPGKFRCWASSAPLPSIQPLWNNSPHPHSHPQ